MKKKIVYFAISLMFLSVFIGCAATSNGYGNIFNNAVANDRSVTIVKKGKFEDIKADVNKNFKALGYEKVLSSVPSQGFIVVSKNVSIAKSMLIGDAHPYKIIIKYTKAGESQTRIDLVNGSTILFSKGEVDQDIQRISESIAD